MYRLAFPALAALLLGTAPQARAADEPKDIIARAVKAHGGEEALAKLQAGQATNTGKMDIPGIGEVEFTQQLSFMMPDKLKETLEFSVGGQKVKVVTVADGGKVSITANGNDVPVSDQIKETLKSAQYMMKVARLVTLVRDKGYDLSLIGEVKVNGKPAVGVLVSKKGEKDISLFFDKETNLLVKVEHRTIAPGGTNEITEERVIAEYKKNADGIPMPKKLVLHHDGKKFLEAEVVEATLLEKLPDSEFKK